MLTKPWTHYTSAAEDRFIETLDLTDSSRKEIQSILTHVAEEAYRQGYRDREDEEQS